jgi:predicted NUDIX family phosphoesterase
MTEHVLVLPRESVPGGCAFHGVRAADAAGLASLRAAVAGDGRFVARSHAEVDPSLKQLIPYVVVRDADRVFLMRRTDAGGDVRLHGKASIGVGGHLNPVDEGADALMAGTKREWAEELDADWDPEFTLLGLLNDDSNAVGAVHLGVVFGVEAAGRPLSVRERDKLSGAFADRSEVVAAWDRLETWSQLVATALGLGPRT